MIPEHHKTNFETLLRAVKAGDCALVECTDKAGKPVYVLCAVERPGQDYNMVPLAKLFDGNPFEEVNPP